MAKALSGKQDVMYNQDISLEGCSVYGWECANTKLKLNIEHIIQDIISEVSVKACMVVNVCCFLL